MRCLFASISSQVSLELAVWIHWSYRCAISVATDLDLLVSTTITLVEESRLFIHSFLFPMVLNILFFLMGKMVWVHDHMSSPSPGKVWSLLLSFAPDLFQFSVDEKRGCVSWKVRFFQTGGIEGLRITLSFVVTRINKYREFLSK